MLGGRGTFPPLMHCVLFRILGTNAARCLIQQCTHVTSLVKFKSNTIHHLKEEFILCWWCHEIMYFMTQSTPLRVRLRRSYITIYELFIKGKHRMIRVERQKTKTNRTIKARSTMAAAILHSAACLSESL